MSDRTPLKPLAPHIVSDDGSIAPFEKQLETYAFGDMPSGDMFVVAGSAVEAGVPEAGDLPILMRQKTMRKVQAAHDISLAEMRNLPDWLRGHPLAMESITEKDGLVVVADARDVHGNDIVVALHLEKEYRQLLLNEIASVYGKRDLAYLVENTVALGKRVYLNERTGGWIRRTGLQLPERIANRLHEQYSAPREHPQGARSGGNPAPRAEQARQSAAEQTVFFDRRARPRAPDLDRDLKAAREQARSRSAEDMRQNRRMGRGPDDGKER